MQSLVSFAVAADVANTMRKGALGEAGPAADIYLTATRGAAGAFAFTVSVGIQGWEA